MTQILSSLGADAPDASGLNETQLLDVYRTMRSIRAFEDRVHDEFATGDIPGFVHLYAGEEASATGVCAHLDPDRDTIASTHRGHGHCIAKGVDIKPMMAEIFGGGRDRVAARAARCTSPTCPRACSARTASSAAGRR